MKELRTIPADVGKIISEARAESGLSLRELAKLTGLSPSAISRCEDGSRQPTVDTLNVLLKALNKELVIL